jgi:hypothetical protein
MSRRLVGPQQGRRGFGGNRCTAAGTMIQVLGGLPLFFRIQFIADESSGRYVSGGHGVYRSSFFADVRDSSPAEVTGTGSHTKEKVVAQAWKNKVGIFGIPAASVR